MMISGQPEQETPPDAAISPQSRPLLLVIIPALNEAASIEQVVTQTRACASRLNELGLKLRVCVIDDGSTDATAETARRAGADHVLTHRFNLGCGAAVRSGLVYGRDTGAGILVKLDADGQHDPADIPALVAPILEGQADIVYGNRFPGITYRMPLVRRMGNTVFRALMRWLTRWDIKDSQPGIFAVNDAYLNVFLLPGDYNYAQQVLLDAYLKGMRFDQVPVAFRKRESGRSFISFKYPFVTLPQILLLLIMVKPLKVFLPLAAVFLATAFGVSAVELAMWLSGHADKPVEHVNLVLGMALFGLNTGFFGLLAELVVRQRS